MHIVEHPEYVPIPLPDTPPAANLKENSPVLRRIGQVVLGLGLVAAPVSVGIGAILAAPPAVIQNVGVDNLDLSVQPHFGDTTKIDFGLLGALRRPNPLHALDHSIGFTLTPSGANVNSLTVNGKFDTATAAALGHIVSDPTAQQAEYKRIRSEVTRYYGTIGFGTAYITAAAEVAGYAMAKRRRQRIQAMHTENKADVAEVVRSYNRTQRMVAAGLIFASIGGAAVAIGQPDRGASVQPNKFLNGTFLQGWQITGPFSDTIPQLVGIADGVSKAEQAFYSTVRVNLRNALQKHYNSPDLAADPDETRIIIGGDEQGTDGMSGIIGYLAQLVHANAILNLGDITATGTSQEALLSNFNMYSLTTLKASAGNIPVYTTLGRHDTAAVATQAAKAGITVIDGKVIYVGGVPVLGYQSPFVVNFGQAPQLRDPNFTLTDAQQKLYERAVAAQDSALLIAGHDGEDMPLLDDTVTEPIRISNHDFTTKPPKTKKVGDQKVTDITLGSSGGHGANDGFGGLGTLRNPGDVLLLTIEHKTGNVYATVFEVNTNTTVSIKLYDLPPLTPDQLKLLKQSPTK